MSRAWWVLVSVACGTFMATLDSSIVNIALPTLTKSLGADLYQVKWVVIAYLLIITCFVLPFGRLSDQYGRKFVFQLGFVIFTIGSGLCGLSQGLSVLVLSRIIQAFGTSMLMANGPAIITAAFPSNHRGSALGIMAMVVSLGLLSGPSIGGLLISRWGWPSIFLVNIPIGLLGVAMVSHFVKKDQVSKQKVPFDWAGAVLQTIFILSFIILFDPPNVSISGSLPFAIPRWAVALLVLGTGALLLKVENEAKAPLLDISLLRNRTFWTANLASFLTFIAFSSVTVLMPFFLEEVLQFSPKDAGLLMTAIPLTIFIVAPLSGKLSDTLGSRELSISGAAIGALGLFIMAGVFGLGLYRAMTPLSIVLVLSTVGMAMGLFQSPNNNAIMGAVPHQKLGVASAILATIRNLGIVTGTGMSTTVFSWRMTLNQGDFVSALHFTFFVAGLISTAAMFACLGKRRDSMRARREAKFGAPL